MKLGVPRLKRTPMTGMIEKDRLWIVFLGWFIVGFTKKTVNRAPKKLKDRVNCFTKIRYFSKKWCTRRFGWRLKKPNNRPSPKFTSHYFYGCYLNHFPHGALPTGFHPGYCMPRAPATPMSGRIATRPLFLGVWWVHMGIVTIWRQKTMCWISFNNIQYPYPLIGD